LSQELKTRKAVEPRAKSSRAKSQEPRAKISRARIRAKSQEPRARAKIRAKSHKENKSQEPRLE
jgi:hypothetical protein